MFSEISHGIIPWSEYVYNVYMSFIQIDNAIDTTESRATILEQI